MHLVPDGKPEQPCRECICFSVPADDGPCRHCFHNIESKFGDFDLFYPVGGNP